MYSLNAWILYIADGVAKMLASWVKDGMLALSDAAAKAGMSEEK